MEELTKVDVGDERFAQKLSVCFANFHPVVCRMMSFTSVEHRRMEKIVVKVALGAVSGSKNREMAFH